MTVPVALTVVVAVQHARENLPDIFGALQPSRHRDVEFIVCHCEADSVISTLVPESENLRILRGAPGSLIPHLWRDGIRAARGEFVAVTTAHCVPAPDWLHVLSQSDLSACAGIGGVIKNDPTSDAKGWAVYLLRYMRYAPPQQAREVAEVAADNAVYRRQEIVRHDDLLQKKGFWEPSFHARFAADHLSLRLDPTLRVVHRNRYTVRQFMGQRWAHGREFGLARAQSADPLRRVFLAAFSPAIPFVYFGKLCKQILGKKGYRLYFLKAMPWFVLFMLSWNAGEIYGYFLSIVAGNNR